MQEINKNNILAVLEYNKSLGLKIDDICIKHGMICYTDNIREISFYSTWDLSSNWLAHIEIDLGKLKPLPVITEYELKIGDVIKCQEIESKIIYFDYAFNYIIMDGQRGFSLNYLVAALATVNGKKYDKITIPTFDFQKYLVDNGFKFDDGFIYAGTELDKALIFLRHNGTYFNSGVDINPTPANAQIIVSMAKLAEGLK